MPRSRPAQSVVLPPAVVMNPADREMLDAAADAERAADEREAMLGDAAVLGDPELKGLVWSVFKLRDANSNVALGENGLGIYWCRLHGPLDLEYLRGLLGGGSFRFVGRGENADGEKVREAHVATLVGPSKMPPPPQPTANEVTQQSSVNGVGDPVLATLIAELRDLKREVTAARQPQTLDPFAMLERITAVMRNLNGGGSSPQGEMQAEKIVEFGMGMLERGVKLGESKEGGEESLSDTVVKLGPVIRDVLQTFRPVRGARTVSGAAPQASAATPAVLPSGLPQPTEQEPSVNPTRIANLVDSLARAAQRHTPAAQLAYSAEDMLNDAELTWLHQQTADNLIGLLVQHFPHYPVFNSESGKNYVRAFLTALAADDSEREALMGAEVADDEADSEEPEA
jgi:hypothetical protein